MLGCLFLRISTNRANSIRDDQSAGESILADSDAGCSIQTATWQTCSHRIGRKDAGAGTNGQIRKKFKSASLRTEAHTYKSLFRESIHCSIKSQSSAGRFWCSKIFVHAEKLQKDSPPLFLWNFITVFRKQNKYWQQWEAQLSTDMPMASTAPKERTLCLKRTRT